MAERPPTDIPATEARGRISEVISRVAFGGERLVLSRNGKPQVAVVSLADLARLQRSGREPTRARASLDPQSVRPPTRVDPAVTAEWQTTREALAAWGAPLAAVRPKAHLPFAEALLRGLAAAQSDGTILRVLPTVLARNLVDLDWDGLRKDARRRKLTAELGWLVELTATLLGRPELAREVEMLRDRRRSRMRCFPLAKSAYEEELAQARSSATAKRWGFWMNLSDDSFRATLEKTLGVTHA